MRYTRIIALALILCILPATITCAITYKRQSFKIFYSIVDPDLVVIGPDDNFSLALHGTYQIIIFESNPINLTLRYNETAIAVKTVADKCIITKFYVNDTQFNINVIRTGHNSNRYLTIEYTAKGGLPPPPPPEPITPGPEVPGIFSGMTDSDIMAMAGATIGLLVCIIPLLGFTVKRVKEHHAAPSEIGTAAVYYRQHEGDVLTGAGKSGKEAKVYQGSAK